MIVFDSHTHVHKLENHPWDSPPERLLRLMDHAGIAVSLIMPYSEATGLDDQGLIQMREACAKYPNRLFYMARLMPKEDACLTLEQELKTNHCLGLKLHPVGYRLPADHPLVIELVQKAGELGCPTMFHCGDEEYSLPLQLEKVAQQCKNSKIILGHMGGYFHVHDAIAVAKSHENVYLESSACPHPRLIELAINELGYERILFGSDGPGCLPALELDKILMLQLSQEELEGILYKNYLRLLPEPKKQKLFCALQEGDLEAVGPFIKETPEFDFRYHVQLNEFNGANEDDFQSSDLRVQGISRAEELIDRKNLIPGFNKKGYAEIHNQLQDYTQNSLHCFSYRIASDEIQNQQIHNPESVKNNKCVSIYLHPFEEGFRLSDTRLHRLILEESSNKAILLAGGFPLVSQPEQCEYLAKQIYPRKLIVSSAGQIDICGAHLNAAYQMMKNCENVLCETSGIYRQDFIEQLITEFGYKRVVYGSGAPFFDEEFERLRFQYLDCQDAPLIASFARWERGESTKDNKSGLKL